jgi:glycosyltransferase involved in cell wall biosynthesis
MEWESDLESRGFGKGHVLEIWSSAKLDLRTAIREFVKGGPKVRILAVNVGYDPHVFGGAEIALRTLARGLAARGCEVTVICLSCNKRDCTRRDGDVTVHALDVHPMGNILAHSRRRLVHKALWQLLADFRGWSRQKIAKIVADERPDVINTHNLVGLSTSTWEVARAAEIPVVHTLHGYQLMCPSGMMFSSGRPCQRQCVSCRLVTTRHRWASMLPDAVVSNSMFTLRTHLDAGYFRRARAVVIPNAAAPPPSGHLTSRVAAVDGTIRIGYLGRLRPEKGIDLLLDALARIPRGCWTLHVGGNGSEEYEQHLRSRARASSLPVTFLGWTDADRLYEAIDLLVIPSTFPEPQAMGLLEAACRHIPVVHSDIGGLGELGNRVPGTVAFRSGSVESLAEVLNRLIADPGHLAAIAMRAQLPASFGDVGQYHESYLEVFDRAIRHGVRGSNAKTATEKAPTPELGKEGISQ